MKGKFIVCDFYKIALLLVQLSPSKGVISGYNQVLQNALICAFFTLAGNYETIVKEFEIGYDGWITTKDYEDFGSSELLKKYIDQNSDIWFSKIIKEQLL